eukprot:TRINITY_DN8400_c0_g1_i12.p2 TRINITY_DN8400_c0_g1~~TRINITY_DN8400_c0_g1_i12.p2  ORF type:complete len:130 (+),score=18.22 TRINITY_DN8400_c0_g1_i12:308-697(+)
MALFLFLVELFSVISSLLLHISCKIDNFKNIVILYALADGGTVPILIYIIFRFIATVRTCDAIQHYYGRCVADAEESCVNPVAKLCTSHFRYSISWITFVSVGFILRVSLVARCSREWEYFWQPRHTSV